MISALLSLLIPSVLLCLNQLWEMVRAHLKKLHILQLLLVVFYCQSGSIFLSMSSHLYIYCFFFNLFVLLLREICEVFPQICGSAYFFHISINFCFTWYKPILSHAYRFRIDDSDRLTPSLW